MLRSWILGLTSGSILCACANAEAHKIRTASFRLDPNAFIIVSQTNEIFGAGFISPDQTTAFL